MTGPWAAQAAPGLWKLPPARRPGWVETFPGVAGKPGGDSHCREFPNDWEHFCFWTRRSFLRRLPGAADKTSTEPFQGSQAPPPPAPEPGYRACRSRPQQPVLTEVW